MEPSVDAMLTANLLIRRHGSAAEEFVATQLWNARREGDKRHVARWQEMLEALKKVRAIRAQSGGEP
jgi:hypothetical protein